MRAMSCRFSLYTVFKSASIYPSQLYSRIYRTDLLFHRKNQLFLKAHPLCSKHFIDVHNSSTARNQRKHNTTTICLVTLFAPAIPGPFALTALSIQIFRLLYTCEQSPPRNQTRTFRPDLCLFSELAEHLPEGYLDEQQVIAVCLGIDGSGCVQWDIVTDFGNRLVEHLEITCFKIPHVHKLVDTRNRSKVLLHQKKICRCRSKSKWTSAIISTFWRPENSA